MRTSTLRRADTTAHWLYCPTLMVQGGAARARWHHQIHLIPRRWLAGVCDRYDQRLQDSGDFHEDDESVEELLRRFDEGAPDADDTMRNGS